MQTWIWTIFGNTSLGTTSTPPTAGSENRLMHLKPSDRLRALATSEKILRTVQYFRLHQIRTGYPNWQEASVLGTEVRHVSRGTSSPRRCMIYHWRNPHLATPWAG